MRFNSRFRVVGLSLMSLGFIAGSVLADDAPQGEDHWTISTLVHGSTSQVRDAINGPLEQQLTRKADKQAKYNEVKQDYDHQMAAVAVELRKSSAEFSKAESDLTAAKAALDAAHVHDDGSGAIQAQNRIQTDEDLIKQKLDAASANDPEVTRNKKAMDDLAVEIRHLGPVIQNAKRARDQLVDGIRFTKRLPGPVSAGGTGVLGKIKPDKIIDGHSFTTDYALFTNTGVDKEAKGGPDGVTAFRGTTLNIKILVVGYDDTSKLKEHVEIVEDHFYKLTNQKVVGGHSYWVVERIQPDEKQQGEERLFAALDDLRVPAAAMSKP